MDIPPLPEECILLVEVGSGAHGTGLEGQEDHDELGIVIESQNEIFGLGHPRKNVMQRTQPDGVRSGPGDVDRTLYPLRSWLRLAAGGNASIILALWAPVIKMDTYGQSLRTIEHLFISRKMIPQYRGYMQGQALRLMGLKQSGHGRRGGGGRSELVEEFGYDTKYAMHAARLGFQCKEILETGKLELPIPGEPGQWLRDVRYGKVPFLEWWERLLELDAELARLQDDESIPAEPEIAIIETWSAAIHMNYWDSHG